MSWKEVFQCPTFKDLNCELHEAPTQHCTMLPLLIIVYKESKTRGCFSKKSFSNCWTQDHLDENFEYKYCMPEDIKDEKRGKKRKKTEDIPNMVNIEDLDDQRKTIQKFIQEILKPEWINTTIIAQDLDGFLFVSILAVLHLTYL
jgi:hypothetical protein